MSEFNDPFPNYEVLAQHDEAHGVIARKKLWRVFWLLLLVTVVEVAVGIFSDDFLPWSADGNKLFLKFFFIGFTIVKAFYIIYVFMHLGEEERWTKWVIIGPFTIFIIYLICMMTIGEGNYAKTRRIDDPVNTENVQTSPEHK